MSEAVVALGGGRVRWRSCEAEVERGGGRAKGC